MGAEQGQGRELASLVGMQYLKEGVTWAQGKWGRTLNAGTVSSVLSGRYQGVTGGVFV